MHKRRADMLSPIAPVLNVQHFLNQCQQLSFECAEVYNEMHELKMAAAEDAKAVADAGGKPAAPTNYRKINELIAKAIEQYGCFVAYFYDHRTGEEPLKFEDTGAA